MSKIQEKKKENGEAACLDDFLRMDWEGEVGPLVWFLNLTPAEMKNEIKGSRLQKDALDPLLAFRSNLGRVLSHFYHILTVEQIKGLENLLSRKLVNAKLSVIILNKSQVRVYTLSRDDIIEGLWLDIICRFLHREDWLDRLGLCCQCDHWFVRSRKDQIYCSTVCKSACFYARRRSVGSRGKHRLYRGGVEVSK